jgi:tRNA A-37 threonylcarbamoyl transferase component Bud32
MRPRTDPTVVQRRRTPPTEELPATPVTGEDAGSSPSHASTRKFTYSSPAETMRADEMLRTRVFLRVVLLLILAVSACLPLLGGDRTFKWVLLGGMALAAVACGAFLWFIRDEDNYSPARMAVPLACCIVAVATACNYFGMYSPAPMVLAFGIYFVSLGSSRHAAVWAFVAAALVHGLGSVLVAVGIVPDRGLIRLGDLTMLERLVMVSVGQCVLFVTFLTGRLSRRATLEAMKRLEQAMKQVGQREALLQEANRDLERALGVGGAQGRYSGERVGEWQLADVIGRGAMGEVYTGQHVSKGTPAAVKLLHAQVEAEPEQLKRFLREAEVMSQLDSPHVVQVHDVGSGVRGGPCFIAMELLHGHDLAWHLRKQRRMAPAKVVELVTQVGSALEVAMLNDIVHRDLKPQNIFLSEPPGMEPSWKVLDFGVSKLGAQSGTLTRGHVLGTPGYMAPEQARGLAVDHRADVFSLAVIAYRALTGRPAFSGADYPKIMFDLVYLQPARPTELVQLPIEVDFALALGLAKRAKDRISTAAQFAEALHRALDGELPASLAQAGQRLIMRHPWGGRAEEENDK